MCFVSLLGMLVVRSFDESDLSIDCLKRHVFVVIVSEYLDRLKLGVSPGDTSEVFGQVKTPTTCLEMSIENISTG